MKLTYLLAAIAMIAAPVTTKAADAAPKPYALEYCVFSGDKLGAMGKVKSEVYEGQEMKFCCNDCKKTFDKDPAAGLKKYQAAVASKSSGGKSAGN
jgi:YHS domain-containing protein